MRSYAMQSVFLPQSVFDEIGQVCKNFLWGDIDHSRSMHLVSWNQVCKPKYVGGLGIRKARRVNDSFMYKIV